MEIRIESLNVNIEAGGQAVNEIAQEVQECIGLAMERLMEEELIICNEGDCPIALDLKMMDWKSLQDKPGIIARLIREAL
jgi:hypothetical protein